MGTTSARISFATRPHRENDDVGVDERERGNRRGAHRFNGDVACRVSFWIVFRTSEVSIFRRGANYQRSSRRVCSAKRHVPRGHRKMAALNAFIRQMIEFAIKPYGY